MIFAPIGFNWQISIALVPGMAAREVAVSALGTIYALSAAARKRQANWRRCSRKLEPRHGAVAARLVRLRAAMPRDAGDVKRETGGWKWVWVMAAYLFALAYAASFVTYRVALLFGAG